MRVIKGKRFEEMELLIKEKQQRIDAVDKLDDSSPVFLKTEGNARSNPLKNCPGSLSLRHERIEGSYRKYLSEAQ